MNIDKLIAELDKSKALALMEILTIRFRLTSDDFDLRGYWDKVPERVYKENNYWELGE